MKQASFCAALAAAICIAMVPSQSWAARYWTGNKDSNWATSGNWTSTSGRRYFRKGNLTGEKRDFIYLSANVTETSNTGLCFYDVPDRGYWRFQGQNQYTFDNSSPSNNKDYDQDSICIGYAGAGVSLPKGYRLSYCGNQVRVVKGGLMLIVR